MTTHEVKMAPSLRAQEMLSVPAVAVAALAALPWVVSYFIVGSGGHDDSHITFYVARTFMETGHFVNYSADAVEQSSSVGLVLILAALGSVTGLSLPVLGYVVSMLGGSASVVLTYLLTKRLLKDVGAASSTAPVLAAATCATTWCLLYWSTCAMETSLAAAAGPALVLGMARYEQEPKRFSRAMVYGLSVLLFVTIRPENVIISVCIAAGLTALALRGPERLWLRSIVWLVGTPLIVTALRLALFGSALPHPVGAKSGGFVWRSGFAYVTDAVIANNAALFIAALVTVSLTAVALLRRRARPTTVVASALLFAQLSFVVLSGGDWMIHGRFLAPTVPIACALAARALVALGGRYYRWGLATVLFVSILQSYRTVNRPSPVLISFRDAASIAEHYPALDARFSRVELSSPPHLRDAPLLVAMDRWLSVLEPRVDRRLVLSSGQAGMIPYYASRDREIQFVDLWSVTGSDVRGCAPEAISRRSPVGTKLKLEQVLSGRLEGPCGIPRPDVVYSDRLRRSTRETLERYGYKVVYRQLGKPKGKRFPGGYQRSGYIAVHGDLLSDEEAQARAERFDWRGS